MKAVSYIILSLGIVPLLFYPMTFLQFTETVAEHIPSWTLLSPIERAVYSTFLGWLLYPLVLGATMYAVRAKLKSGLGGQAVAVSSIPVAYVLVLALLLS